MRRIRSGFTLIEVTMFLVLTALLFVAVAVGTHNSINQQRYNDSIQNFVEFLRGIYSQVSNVENQGQGRSNKAIYGKLITFGEDYDLSEKLMSERNGIFTYDVVGNVGDIGTGSALDALDSLNANVIFADKETSKLYTLGMAESYTPRWGARIEKTDSYTDFTGSILIVRHPRSGTVFTYYLDKVIQVNKAKYDQNFMIQGDEIDITEAMDASINPLKAELKNFEVRDIDFCINPDGNEARRLRQDVRLVKGARNASGIIMVSNDNEDEKCSKK